MKTFKLSYLLYIFLLLNLQACQDKFLELDPKTNKMEGNSYVTENDAFLALTAVYDVHSHQEVLNFTPYRSDIFSDDTYTAGEPPSGGMTSRWQCMETSTMDAESATPKEEWKKCYKGIYRANQYLTKQEGITWENQANKARFAAEAKFFIAYFYFDLVRHFGWVPLVTDLITATEARNLQQAEPIETYTHIAKNLLEAIPNLPETVTPNEYGRVTKAAAQVLLARIYLHYDGFGRKQFGITTDWTDGNTIIDKTKVRNELEEIINKGNYVLLNSYADVHSWENENNAESIFEIQYSEKSEFSDFDKTELVNGNTSCFIIGPRNPKGDSTIVSGWSFGTITWSLYNEFEPGDDRFDVTIYNANEKLTSYTPGYHNTGYFNNKYMARQAYNVPNAVHNMPKNHIDMRYAEVLLTAAELWLTDDNAKATAYLNQVRTRSMGASAALSSIDLDDIYHERRVEFACEGLRYWDLLRRGLDYAKEKIDASYIPDPSYPAPDEFLGYYFDLRHMGMIPIPADEIRNSNEGVTEQKIDFYK